MSDNDFTFVYFYACLYFCSFFMTYALCYIPVVSYKLGKKGSLLDYLSTLG